MLDTIAPPEAAQKPSKPRRVGEDHLPQVVRDYLRSDGGIPMALWDDEPLVWVGWDEVCEAARFEGLRRCLDAVEDLRRAGEREFLGPAHLEVLLGPRGVARLRRTYERNRDPRRWANSFTVHAASTF